MTEAIFNHNEIYFHLYNGNTTQAIKIFTEKTCPEDFTPFLRTSYLSSLNFGIYNYVLLQENISLHQCCMENERKIMKVTNESFLEVGADIINSYGNDSQYMIEKHSNNHIKAAIAYIHKHLSEPITLTSVSEAVSINSAYLSDLFKKEVNMNFNQYITEQRMKSAKKLLKNTDLSIQEISERCGYKSVAYFSNSFKKCSGIKPSEYRKCQSP